MKERSKRSPARRASDPFLDFTSSVHFDSRLWRFDVAGSIAHARALASAGVVTAAESDAIIGGLKSIAHDIEHDRVVFDPELEDVHMNIESMLTRRIGTVGAKLHTGRSRNDQIALDMRLFTREALADIAADATALQEVLLAKSEKATNAVLPGMTHMQHAQPVLLSHHLMAHFWRLQRDVERLRACYARTNISPLGSGALAGTSFKIPRKQVAKDLGMRGVTENSIDTVSDRDFVAETAFALSLLQIHLSSIGEELVLWSSSEFGFLKLPRDLASGSSMMPQKLNPDIPELIRGKSGRAVGDLVAILTLLKSLPLAYNRDLQEDKESLFDVVDTVGESLRALKTFLAKAEFDEVRMRSSAGIGLMTATDLADLLATKGIPFRNAHALVRKAAIESDGDGERFVEIAERLVASKGRTPRGSLADYLTVDRAVERRATEGGTSTSAVKGQMVKAKRALTASGVHQRRFRRDISAMERLMA